MYKQLLLSHGGGIIPDNIKAGMNNCAVINIGLGGTGIDCLERTKKEVYDNILPDQDTDIPEYSHIKFLAVDKYSEWRFSQDICFNNSDLTVDEYFDVSFNDHLGKSLWESSNIIENSPEYREWFDFKKFLVPYNTSPGIFRQVGRYLLIRKAKEFVDKIRSLVVEAKKRLNDPYIYVNIFSGMSGAMGSGAFLDVCYLVQKAIKFEKAQAYTFGYFFMPDVNIAKVSDKETKNFIQVNGYASLQELDYCMNFDTNGDKWHQEYPDIGLIETKNQPVDFCFLISDKGMGGSVFVDPYNSAISSVAKFCAEWMICYDYSLISFLAGFNAKLSMINKLDGAARKYCNLGFSEAKIPVNEILTYLTAKMFDDFKSVKKNEPDQKSVDAFVKANGLAFDDLYNMLTLKANMSFPMPDISYRDAYENDDLTTTYFVVLRAEVIEVVSRNFDQMSKKIENFDIAFDDKNTKSNNVHASSIITRIFKALYTCITDPSKGPHFASKLVNGTSCESLISVIDGHLQNIDKKISQLECNLGQYERKREMAKYNFFVSRPRRRTYMEYAYSTRDLVIQYTLQEIYYIAKNIYYKLRKQLFDLYNNFLLPYCNVLNNLIDTFEANKSNLELENVGCFAKAFEYPIVTINDLKESLDKKIKEFDIPKTMELFQKYMLSADGYQSWITKNEKEISKLVSKYFIDLFPEYTNKTMTDYLKEKYKTYSTDELSHCIRNDIMNHLDFIASPLFWPSEFFDFPKAGCISVPVTSYEACQAAEELSLANPELRVRTTVLMDRITVMRIAVGIPLFGYKPIKQYEVKSLNDKEYGKHLYEGREYVDDNGETVRGREWRNLPSLTPLSKMDENNSSFLFETAQKAKSVYEEAESLGLIIDVGSGEYGLRTIDDSFFYEIIEISKNAKISKYDPAIISEIIKEIKNKRNNLKFLKKIYHIKDDAQNGYGRIGEQERKQVRVDHFAFAPKLVKIAENEIEKIKKIDEIIASLESKIDTDFENFANALFTGAVKINGFMLTYENDCHKGVRFSSPNMPMGGIKLYQAFMSFKELDDSTKEKLKSISEKRNAMKEGRECIINACKNIKKQLAPEKIEIILKYSVNRIGFNKFKKYRIADFYKKLSDRFNEYLISHHLFINE